jgi:hypothetical protein
MRSEFWTNAEWMIFNWFKLRSAQSHYVVTYLSFVFPANLIWLLHCNAMHIDSVSNKRSGRTLTLISFIISFVKHRTRCTTRLATTGGRKFSVVIASTSLAGSQTGESSPAERARERAMLLTANTARLTDVPSSGHYFFSFSLKV